jgi:N-acetylglucosamine malate deacetylase 1
MTRLREWRRRCLTRLQLFYLVHLASQPHALSHQSAMVVAPHHDAEVLGCGGLIALKRRAGVSVQIVFVTDGAASQNPLAAGDVQLAATRRLEALKAADILGVPASDVHFLDRPDGHLRQLAPDDRQATVAELAQLLATHQPQELYVPHRHDRTEDHEASYDLVMAALRASPCEAEVFQYAVWMLWSSLVFRDYPRAELQGARRLRIHAVRDQKTLALQAHRSQWQPRDQGLAPVLEPQFLSRFCLPNEVFFRPEPQQAPRSRA